MLQYMPEDVLVNKLTKTAILYNKILNVSIDNDALKQSLIKINH